VRSPAQPHQEGKHGTDAGPEQGDLGVVSRLGKGGQLRRILDVGGEDDVIQLQRYVGSLLVGASLLAPKGVKAAGLAPSPRAEECVRRYYDREHRD